MRSDKLRGFAHLADVTEGVDSINGVKPSSPDRAPYDKSKTPQMTIALWSFNRS